MADQDENTKVVDPVVEEPEKVETPSTEPDEPRETVEEPEAPQTEEEPKAGDEPAEQQEEAEEAKPPSRREQLRVQALLKKYGDPSERVPEKVDKPDFRKTVAADDDTYGLIEQEAQKYGETQYNKGLQEAQFNTWTRFLKMEDAQAKTKYPEIDPSNEAFHPAIADSLNAKYLAFVGYEPGDPNHGIAPSVRRADISYVDFIDAEMEYAEELAARKVARTTENIAKQAATTGLRPDGSSPKQMDLNKLPHQMTKEELTARIARDLGTTQ